MPNLPFQLLTSTLEAPSAFEGSYDLQLVALSILLMTIAAFTAMKVADGMASAMNQPVSQAVSHATRPVWLAFGAISLGAGMWFMNSLGALALSPPKSASYDPVLVLVGVVPGVIASAAMLHVVGRTELSTWHAIIGALWLSLGATATALVMLAARAAPAEMIDHRGLLALAAAVAFALSMLALQTRAWLKSRSAFARLDCEMVSAAIVACAVAGSHYAGMAAARLLPDAGASASAGGIAPDTLARAVLLGSLLVPAIAAFGVMMERRLQRAKKMSLGDSHRYTGDLVDCIADGVYGIDDQGHGTFVNAAGARMLGYSPNELLGQPLFPLLHRVERRPGEFNEPRTETGAYMWRKDGSAFETEHTIMPVRNGDSVAGSVVSFRDVSQKMRTEQAMLWSMHSAEEASQAKSSFLANMSHEIRTPMNGVLGMTSLILDTRLDNEQRELAQTIANSAESLLHLLNDALDFSKIEAGKLDMEQVPCDLEAAIRDVAELLRGRANEQRTELAVRYAPGAPRHVVADIGRIRQVVTNLLSNAIKFTSDGEVTLNVEVHDASATGARFKISVADTGIGIPARKLTSIFDEFTQADMSTTRRFGGTGLGLAISSGLVTLMNGTIAVESREGEGSTFTVCLELPLADAPVEVVTQRQLRGVRVLVVDDNAVNRRILEEQTRAWGADCTSASCAAQAWEQMTSAASAGEPFDVALLDYLMPGEDGVQLAERIKSDPALERTALVLLTSSPESSDAASLKRIGFVGRAAKPVRPANLLALMVDAASGKGTDKERPVLRPTVDVRQRSHGTGSRSLDREIHALVAEDNTVNQKVAKRMLENLGCTVEIAADGVEAVEMVNSGGYDIVFMDCQMPNLDGLMATRAIREADPSGTRLPIIAMTANAMNGAQEDCLAAGMDGYLTKPTTVDALVSMLEKTLAEETACCT